MTDKLLDRELALFEGIDDLEEARYDKLGTSTTHSGETTSTGGRSKHMSMDLAGSVFLISSDGRLLDLPVPSESPHDPLNWVTARRVLIWTLLSLYSIIAMFLIQTPGNLFLAFINEFDGQVSNHTKHGLRCFLDSDALDKGANACKQDMAPFTVDILASCPTLLMGVSFFIWLPLCIAFGRRPVILLSAVTLFVATLRAGFAHDFYQLLAAICFIGFAGGATISTVSLHPSAENHMSTATGI